MNKFLLAFACFFSATTLLRAQDISVNQTWVTLLKGTGIEQGRAITTDLNHNVYCTGEFNDSILGERNKLACKGVKDIFICATNALGEVQWIEQAGGTGMDLANYIHMAPSGNLWITGSYNGTAQFGQTPPLDGNSHIFVAKYTTKGEALLAQSIASKGFGQGSVLASDSAGHILVAGTFRGSISLAGQTHMAVEGADIFVAKLDPQGKELWLATVSSKGSSACERLWCYGNTIYLAGQLGGAATLGNINIDPNHSNKHFIASISADGFFKSAQLTGAVNTLGNARGTVLPNGIRHQTGTITTAANNTLIHKAFIAQIIPANSLLIKHLKVVHIPCDDSTALGQIGITASETTGVSYSIDGGATWQADSIFRSLPKGDYLPSIRNEFYEVSAPVTAIHDAWPEITLSSQQERYCATDSNETLQLAPIDGQLWGNGIVNDSTFSPGAAGGGVHQIYYKAVAEHGCEKTDTLSIEVIDIRNPVTESDLLLYPEDTITIVPNYQFVELIWNDSLRTPSYFIDAARLTLARSFVHFAATDEHGCAITDSVELFLYKPDDPQKDTLNINAYPNPVRTTLYFYIESYEDEVIEIELFDISGIKVGDYKAMATPVRNTYTIDLNGLANGIFYIKTKRQNRGFKIVKTGAVH